MIFKIPIEKFNTATSYKKRDCYSQLEEYINGDNTNVCTLYGLRRTGKSTMMFQAMNDIGLEHCGYILCEDGDNYGSLCQKLDEYISQGKKAVFIDEITKLSNFITSSASLADYYSGSGTKIIITGTDSLGLNLVTCGELHNRVELIHTTYISYGEFSRLIEKTDIDDFIHYAGVLSHEDKESNREFFDRKSASRYIDSAISNNITNTFFKDKLPASFAHKYDKLVGLQNRNMLIPTITAIVEMYSGIITKDAIDAYFGQEAYFNADISSALQLLGKHNIFIDKENFHDDFEGQIVSAINSRRAVNDTVEPEAVSQIVDYLYDLELIVSIPLVRHNDTDNAKRRGREFQYESTEYIYQAGIKYCQAKAIIEVIKNSNDIDLSPAEREILCQKIEDDVKGQILEISIYNDLLKLLDNNKYDIFKMDFTGDKDGEIDIVIRDKQNKEYYCFEVKHSKQIDEHQQINLSYSPFKEIMDRNYGTRKFSAVIYRGDTISPNENEIAYLNVERFLSLLYLSPEPTIDQIIQDCLDSNKQIEINKINKPKGPSSGISSELQNLVENLSEFGNNIKKGVSETVAKEKERVQYSFEHIAKQIKHSFELSR